MSSIDVLVQPATATFDEEATLEQRIAARRQRLTELAAMPREEAEAIMAAWKPRIIRMRVDKVVMA